MQEPVDGILADRVSYNGGSVTALPDAARCGRLSHHVHRSIVNIHERSHVSLVLCSLLVRLFLLLCNLLLSLMTQLLKLAPVIIPLDLNLGSLIKLDVRDVDEVVGDVGVERG